MRELLVIFLLSGEGQKWPTEEERNHNEIVDISSPHYFYD